MASGDAAVGGFCKPKSNNALGEMHLTRGDVQQVSRVFSANITLRRRDGSGSRCASGSEINASASPPRREIKLRHMLHLHPKQ